MISTRTAEIYGKNLGVLRHRFPHIHELIAAGDIHPDLGARLFLSRMGQMNATMEVNGKKTPYYLEEDILRTTAQSMKDWRLSGGDHLFCIGMGLGYLPMMAADLFSRQKNHQRPKIMIFERFPAMFQLALRALDLRRLLEYQGLEIHLGDSMDIVGTVNRLSFEIFLGKQRVVSDGNSRRIFGEQVAGIESELIDCIGIARDLWFTTKELGPRIFSNTVKNLPTLFSSVTLGKVRGALAGVPAVCVAAGPSLDDAVPILKEIGNRALILAVDSAIPTLVSAGIRPHMVVTADARSVNFRKYRAYVDALRDTVLVYALESNPDNVSKFLSRRKLAVSINNPVLNHWLNKCWDLECALPAMTTVTHAAVFAAMALGADPIVFVGMDMAFPEGRSHARGAMHHYNINPKGLVPVDGVNGAPVFTYRPLSDCRIQIEKVIVGGDERFINTSTDGAWIKGTIVKTLEEVLDTETSPEADVSQRLDALDWTDAVDTREVNEEISRMQDAVDDFIHFCKTGRTLAAQAKAVVSTGGADKSLRMEAVSRHWDKFEATHHRLIDMLWGTQLDAVKGIELRKRALAALDPQLLDTSTVNTEEMAILGDTFSSNENAAMRFRNDLSQVVSRYKRYHPSLEGEPAVTIETLMADARFLAETGDVQKAETCLDFCRRLAPDQVAVPLALIEVYTRYEMWLPALKIVEEALETFHDNDQIIKDFISIRQKTNQLCDDAAGAILAGEHDKARILIFEYLSIFPEDRSAQMIKSFLAKRQGQTARALMTGDRCGESVKKMAVARLEAVEDLITGGEWERGIGMLKWLARKNSDNAADFYRRIAELRMDQKDYRSALWHYSRILDSAPGNVELRDKIENLKSKIERRVPVSSDETTGGGINTGANP